MSARVARRQWGGATLIVIAGALVLSTMAIGAVTMGRLAIQRLDTQRAADAAVLAALEIARGRGMPLDSAAEAAAARIGDGNSALALRFAWRVHETDTALVLETTARARVPVPGLLGGGVTEVTAVARGRIPQLRFDRVDRPRAALSLVLDYSGSMMQPFSGGQRRAVDVLEDAVRRLLDAKFDIQYGAVFYGTRLLESIAIDRDTDDLIARALDDHDAQGETDTGGALEHALVQLQGVADTGRNVLLISDGEPCCAGDAYPRARAAATALWDQGVTIFTLEIRRKDTSDVMSRFMTDIAGSPARRGDPDKHIVARTGDDLVAALDTIGRALACTAGPLPAPADPALLRVFLDEGGAERPVPAADDIGKVRYDERYAYEAGGRVLRLSRAVCAAVDGGADLIVRTGRGGLAP